ncbi:hypothetical protein F511_27169 [Dorcoceras hygrometricum]|uniref:Splicing factor 3B subunit 1-like n=1 Tax=Dorcoceras hygrometricum TaxID=472368 RepID=A0A2Z7C8H7_9LAMI|nr:hypothetical protein F511_27169 [Dorcoceras hygrometricum]
MASSLIANALQVNFDSVLGIYDNDAIVKMFRALESTGLRGFLGYPSVLYEKELEQFFDTTLVKYNEILCVIHEKVVVITEDRFVGVFELPTAGLTDLLEVPKNLVFDARSLFSQSGEPFDVVTHECSVLMTAIHFELKVNWSKRLFDTLKEMADKSSKRAKGYAAQICFLLKGEPSVTLGEATTFPPLKILFAKTVGTYVATNKTIDARGESDEPEVTKVAVVKRKSVSKKRSASTANKDTDEVQVETVAPAVKKKRTATGRAAPAEKDLALVTVAQDALPIQIVEPISAVPVEHPHAQKRKAMKINLRLSTGSDDEIVEKDPDVAEGEAIGTDLAEPVVSRSEDDDMSGVDHTSKIIDKEEESVKNKETDSPLVVTVTGKEIDPEPMADVGQIPSDEELLSIEDLLKRIPKGMMIPSVTAAEPTKIKFGHGITIKGVADKVWYKESFPKIAITDEGKAPLVEPDTIKGHPAMRWRLYIVAKYRELLLRKFLEAHRANFSFGQPWSAMALQIIDLLSAAHSTSTKNLLMQKQALNLEWTSCAMLFKGAIFDIALRYPVQSNSSYSRMLFTAADIPLNDETAVDQLVLPAIALHTPDLAESLAQLRTSVSQLSIKQMRTTSSIGDLRNELLSKIDNIEKAATESRTKQDQCHRNNRLADIVKDFKAQKADFDDQLAAICTDLLEFRVETQEQYATLRDNLSELIAFFNRVHDDKKGEVGSSQGQPPPDDRSRPGGYGGSRSEPVKRRGSGSKSGPRRRGLGYWFGGE